MKMTAPAIFVYDEAIDMTFAFIVRQPVLKRLNVEFDKLYFDPQLGFKPIPLEVMKRADSPTNVATWQRLFWKGYSEQYSMLFDIMLVEMHSDILHNWLNEHDIELRHAVLSLDGKLHNPYVAQFHDDLETEYLERMSSCSRTKPEDCPVLMNSDICLDKAPRIVRQGGNTQ